MSKRSTRKENKKKNTGLDTANFRYKGFERIVVYATIFFFASRQLIFRRARLSKKQRSL
jgi:hypothetical protein